MCLCTVALIQSCVKQQESLPWLQWFGDLALMLALRNKQKLLLWQCEIIVSFVCHGAPAHRANKAQLTSRSAQPEMHFRKAFARVLSNQSDKHETNVTAIFSSTKLHFINTYLWLDKKNPWARKSVLDWIHKAVQKLWSCCQPYKGSRAGLGGCWEQAVQKSTGGQSQLRTGRMVPQKTNTRNVWETQ